MRKYLPFIIPFGAVIVAAALFAQDPHALRAALIVLLVGCGLGLTLWALRK